MLQDEIIELASVAKSCITVIGCQYPHSLVNVFVGMIHEEDPPIFIFISDHYKYKCIYIPCSVYKSKLIIKGKNIV